RGGLLGQRPSGGRSYTTRGDATEPGHKNSPMPVATAVVRYGLASARDSVGRMPTERPPAAGGALAVYSACMFTAVYPWTILRRPSGWLASALDMIGMSRPVNRRWPLLTPGYHREAATGGRGADNDERSDRQSFDHHKRAYHRGLGCTNEPGSHQAIHVRRDRRYGLARGLPDQ